MKAITAIFTLAILSGIGGCETQGPSAAQTFVSSMAPNDVTQYDGVFVNDKSLQSYNGIYTTGVLSISPLGGHHTETGALKVWATIRNRTDSPIEIMCRTSFYSHDLAPEEEPSAWKRIFISSNGVQSYEEVSTGISDVSHFRIEIQSGT